MISVDKFCENILSCVGSPYESPGTTDLKKIQNGAGVDCSGLLVAAAKPLGLALSHNSNTMWRKYMTEKGSVSDHTSDNGYPKDVNPLKSSQLKKGMALFKWNPNDKYHDGLGDYQHIAVVTSVKPLKITHASTEGNRVVKTDSKIGRFCAWGYIKGVDYGENEQPEQKKEDKKMENATGRLKTLVTLNVRDGADVTCEKIGSIEKGKEVDFSGIPANGWVEIEYKGKSGWIATKNGSRDYVEVVEVYGQEGDDENIDTDTDEYEPTQDEMIQEICEGMTVHTRQITEICRILKKKGFDISSIPGMRL